MPVGGLVPRTADNGADVVVRNAKIYTGDRGRPHAGALAIRDGRVLVVGDDAEVAPVVGPATTVVDALGRRVVPGLNDAHVHVIRGGLAGTERPLGPAQRRHRPGQESRTPST